MTATIRQTVATFAVALVVAVALPLTASATTPVVDDPPEVVELPVPEASVEVDLDALPSAEDGEPTGPATGARATDRPEDDEHSREPDERSREPDEHSREADEPDEADETPRERVAARGAATHVAAGRNHALVLDSDGQVWAWGSNSDGQLGDGTTTHSSTPVAVDMDGALAGEEVVAVAAGHWHSMALSADGRVYTWGRNAEGALGDGTTVSSPVPVRVDGLLADQQVVRIDGNGGSEVDSGTFGTSAALGDDGRVYTWGSGAFGRLGIGSSPEVQSTPALVGGLLADLRVVDLSVAHRQTVALSDDGRVFMWGWRTEGAMGDGDPTSGVQDTPTAVTMSGALADVQVVQVTAGSNRGQALSDDGEIFGWGRNTSGQLATGTTEPALEPVRADTAAVDEITGQPVAIVSSQNFGLAVGENGRVASWGENGNGQLGDGSNAPSARAVAVAPDSVLADASVVQASAQGNTVLALADDGRVFAWGNGRNGQLGDGSTSSSTVPVQSGSLRVATSPSDTTVPPGAQATFSASSAGVPASVQWETSGDGGESWSQVVGATLSTYTTPPVTGETGGHQVRAVFTSLSDFPSARGVVVTSQAATLTVDMPPVVTEHPPERVRSLVGLEVPLSADAEGAAPMTVQWQSSSDQGRVWTDLAGATGRTHTVTAAEPLHGSLYRAVFSNPSGTATTRETLLEVVVTAPGAKLTLRPVVRYVTNLDRSST